MLPFGMIRATLLLLESVNQKLPSSPIVLANGWACREGEHGESAGKLEMLPGEDESGNDGLDEVKTRYHEAKNVGRICG